MFNLSTALSSKFPKKVPFFIRFLRLTISVIVVVSLVVIVTYGSHALFTHVLSYINKNIFSKFGLNSKDFPAEVVVDAEKFTKTADNASRTLKLKVAIVSDSHNYNGILKQSLEIADKNSVDLVIHLGDLTDWGDIQSLQYSKDTLDVVGIEYIVLPGDHDIAQSIGMDNFIQVFKNSIYPLIATKNDVTISLINNSANFTVMSDSTLETSIEAIKKSDFVFMSQPVFDNGGYRQMGYVDGDAQNDVLNQSVALLEALRDSKVRGVFAGDLHQSRVITDSIKPELKHYAVGALTASRNLESPRFSILSVYEDGGFEVEEVVLESSK